MGIFKEEVFGIVVFLLAVGVVALVAFQLKVKRRPQRSLGEMYRPFNKAKASESELKD